MGSPASRKRRVRVANEGETSRVAPTPKKAPRRGQETLETPPNVSDMATRDNVALIPGTADAQVNNNQAAEVDTSLMVTPNDHKKSRAAKRVLNNPRARRAINMNNDSPEEDVPPPVTPAHNTSKLATVTPPPTEGEKPAKRRLIFGKLVDEIVIQPNTTRVYNVVKKLTGGLGGNGSCGPIYGELTKGSMQKMVNLMRHHTQLDSTCRFLDVGSGIGKPNLHVTQDPGVAFSCGIEMELDRYRLGLKCLQLVLQEAAKEATDDSLPDKIQHKCMFVHGNIMQAHTFDPFTHVYMFSIGFPPKLWVHLSEAWNRSGSPYLVCFHSPRTIINDYEFDAELLAQMPTSMHASGEGHTGYIYQRKGITQQDIDSYIADAPCDKVFKESYQQVKNGIGPLKEAVDQTVAENWTSRGRSMTRSEARKHGIVLSKT